ncbi:MAG: hypothetical protein PVF94_01205 [Desulfobacterales bacterium]|jgi:hypothetical protein
MLIHDDIFSWRGWGGKLMLGSGKCRLRIYDLKKGDKNDLMHLRPIIVIVSDVPDSKMEVRGATSHVATLVAKEFNIDPHRMLYIEYYPEHSYGVNDKYVISEKFDAVEFTWHDGMAIKPKWRTLKPPLLDEIKKLLNS